MADYKGAIELLNNNCFPNRNGIKSTFVILHGTAGGSSAEEIAQYFKGTEGGPNPVSAHYVVDEQGIVYQCNLESTAAWANGPISGTPTANLPFRTQGDEVHRDDWWNPNINPNYQTISIEHVKPDDENVTVLTPAQQAASFALIKDICQRNNIPIRFANASGGITGHFSMDPAERSLCPNTYPWDALWAYLQGEKTMAINLSTPGISSYFKANGATWQCIKTGFLIGGGILGFYQKFGGDALCGLSYLGLPVSNEQSVSGHPGVVNQEFERGTVRWDPNHELDAPPGAGDVYLVHVEQDPRNAALVAQVATLQGENTALKSLPVVSTLNQINTLGQQIVKLSQVQ